jgi:hypothetical protein
MDIWPGSGQESCTPTLVQAQAERELSHRGRAGRSSGAALEIGDPASAETSTFGEFFLREPCLQTETLQQDTEGV